MSKDNQVYLGIPIFGQLLQLFPKNVFNNSVSQTNSELYHRTVDTWSHFVFMAYGVLTTSSSLRDIGKNFELLGDKINHLSLKSIPARSSISDANRLRSASVFGHLYLSLYVHFKPFFSDSCYLKELINGEVNPKNVEIFDSSTVSLFTDIFKNTGRTPLDGKKKGGIKAFTKITLSERVPNLVVLKDASSNEKSFLNRLSLSEGSIAVFDKGFQKYSQYEKWSKKNINYVTRLNDNAKFKILEELPLEEISEDEVIKDSIIELSYRSKTKKEVRKTKARIVAYIDPVSNEKLVFVTNNCTLKAKTIALLYKNRWTIEPLFKQIKQNFELTYFLSDSKEGIKTQIWIAMILNLLFTVLHKKIKEAEDFRMIVRVASKNLYSYVNYTLFLEFPELIKKANREKIKSNLEKMQFSLFDIDIGG